MLSQVSLNSEGISVKDLAKISKDIVNDCRTFCSDNQELDSFIDVIAKAKITEVINNLNL